MRYIPTSKTDRDAMLADIGVASVDDLFTSIPGDLRLQRPLDLPGGLTEPELVDLFHALAARNHARVDSFLGAGVYPHTIPAVVGELVARSEFYTAYTPYQPEIAQGTLQAIFEFQTYLTQLTGMEVANASLYDGSTALAEAVLMAQRIAKRPRVLLASSIHPEYRRVVETYTARLDMKMETVAFAANGQLDFARLSDALDEQVAAVVVQSPNFFGALEDLPRCAERCHESGALLLVNVAEAMSLGVLKGPGALGSPASSADIVVGEGQSLGIPMSFGGPHVGFIAARSEHVRQLPGRIVGQGHDANGRRAFVLTLAAREQHIRRERATSNICTNQSLCAVMATIYLAVVGPEGLRQVAAENMQKAAYVRQRIQDETPHRLRFDAPLYNEFVVELDDFDSVWERLLAAGTVPGFPLRRFYPALKDSLLICVTERHSIAAIDRLIQGLAA